MTRSRAHLMVAAAVIVVMLGLLAVGYTATALTNGTFRDEFRVMGFNGDDGSLPWSGPWYEIGESDGPNAGAVRVKVTSDCVAEACIEIGKLTGNDGSAIGRQADLSGAGSAVLNFSYNRENSLAAGTGIRLLASATGASPWTQVAYYSLDAEDAEILHEVVSLHRQCGDRRLGDSASDDYHHYDDHHYYYDDDDHHDYYDDDDHHDYYDDDDHHDYYNDCAVDAYDDYDDCAVDDTDYYDDCPIVGDDIDYHDDCAVADYNHHNVAGYDDDHHVGSG